MRLLEIQNYGSPLQTTLDQSKHYASLHEMYHDWDCFAANGWGFSHIQSCDAKDVGLFLPYGPREFDHDYVPPTYYNGGDPDYI